MLAQVLIAEADPFVAQWKDLKLPDGGYRVVRHGHGPQCEFQTGIGPAEVRRAKVRDRRAVGRYGGRLAATSAALAARAHWLTVEWLPKYAPELTDIEMVWHNLKAFNLAHTIPLPIWTPGRLGGFWPRGSGHLIRDPSQGGGAETDDKPHGGYGFDRAWTKLRRLFAMLQAHSG